MLRVVRRAVEAAVVAVAAWLLCVRAHAPVHLDTARDLLLARDAAGGFARGLAGPPSSFGHLVQGAAWIHVLEAARSLGLGVGVVEQTVRVSLAVATGGVFAMARASASLRAAVTAAAVHAVAAPLLVGFPVLWNPSLTALAAVAFFASLRAGARHPSAAAVGAAAVTLACLMDLHLVAVLLLPALLAMAFLGRRALPGFFVAGAGVGLGGAILWGSSGDAMVENAGTLAQHPAATATGTVVLAAATVTLALRWRRACSPGRVTLDTAVLFAVLLVAGSLVAGRPASVRYWVPIGPAACLGLGNLFARLRGRFALGAGIGLGGLCLANAPELIVPPSDRGVTWSLIEAERCATTLATRGWTGHGARRSLDAPGGSAFVSSLAAFLPLGAPRDSPPRLLVMRAGGTCVEISTPVVDVARGQRCIGTECLSLRAAEDRSPTGFVALAYPRRWELTPAPPPGPHHVWYVLPSVPPGPSGALIALGDAATAWTAERRDRVVTVSADVERPWEDDGWPPVVLPAVTSAASP